MRDLKYNLILNIFLFVIGICLSSQSVAQEKVLLTTDREIYIAGEDLWFHVGAYKLNTGNISDLSKVVYIELLNEKNIPVLQVKCRINESSTQSRVVIPDSVSTGIYNIRAYTRWMRNKDISLFAKKSISIINPFSQNSFPKGDKYFTQDTIFTFPECGKLFPEVENKVLLLARNKNGRRHKVEGKVVDDLGNLIVEFKTDENGYDVVNFTPKKNVEYFYLLEESKISLPKVSDDEIYLKLLREGVDEYIFKIYGNLSELKSLDLVSLDGNLLNSYTIKETDEIKIPIRNLQNQRMFVLLLDNKNNVVGYRGFCPKGSLDRSNITINLDKEPYKRREKVNIQIDNVYNLQDVTVSVVKKCLYPKSEFELINNNSLLSTKPPVFIAKNEKLLLPELEGELITGRITNSKTGASVIGKKFILNIIGDTPIWKFATTDSLGEFRFVINRFGEEEMVIQPFPIDTALLDYSVTLHNDFSLKYDNYKKNPFILDSISAKRINDAIVNMQINAVYKPYTRNVAIADSIEKQDAFYGEPEIATNIDKFIELPTVEEVVREIVPYTVVKKTKGLYYFRVIEERSHFTRYCTTMTLLDGVPMRNLEEIFKMDPQDLEKIEVINLSFHLKDEELGFLLNFYTKNGDMADIKFDNRIFRQAHNGYLYSYHYESPNYSNEMNKNSRLPDFRNTLYFNTFKRNDNNSPLNVSFFTSDEETEYIIVVRGVNNIGQIEEIRKSFRVSGT